MMDWRRYPSNNPADPDGIGNLLQRLDAEVEGGPVQGARFAHDGHGMCSTIRELEARGAGVADELYVGFGDAATLERDRDIYSAIASAGTRVFGFGTGEPERPVPGVRWVSLPEDPLALANQRFLVTREPEPTACVGFGMPREEAAPEAAVPATGPGADGAEDEDEPATVWEGFTSSDPRVVEALLQHLGGLAAERAASA